MPDLDPELLERAVRWCAEAGRQVGAQDVRRALSPLGWEELLAVRALLADPPPARPLGPHALADLARGAPPDVAAEREREGRYRAEGPSSGADATEGEAAADARPPAARTAPSRRRRRGPGVVVRRARDREPPPPEAPAPPPPLDELRRPEGRAVLERLVRRHGARRAPILAALAAGWSGPEGAPPGDADLSALLDHHGLARAFERRERDEALHALRAASGVRAVAAERLGLDEARLAASLARLGATAQAERIRDDRRAELRGRATLAERVRLLLAEAPKLRDLDLLDEFERDLRARLPEHVRALRAGAEPIEISLARSLSLSRADAEALAARFGLDLGPGPGARARSGATVRPASGPKPGRSAQPRNLAAGRARGSDRRERPARPRTARGAPRAGPGPRKAPRGAPGAGAREPPRPGGDGRRGSGSRGPRGPRGGAGRR